MASLEELLIDPRMKESLDRYAAHGVPTGSCLRAILAGDLYDAFARADPLTTAAMPHIVRYIRLHLPNGCWGRPDLVDGWIEMHRGRVAADRKPAE